MAASGEGEFKVVLTDAQENLLGTSLGPIRTTRLDASTLPSEQYVVPYGADMIGENSKMILFMKGDAATAVNNTSVIDIPVTFYNTVTKRESPGYLGVGDFSDLTVADVTISATNYTRFGTYTVPAQLKVRLGHKDRANSTMYVSLNKA